MVKEINLFDKEILELPKDATSQMTTPPAAATLPKVPPARSVQPALPGIMENIQENQRIQQQEKFIKQHAKRIIEALLFALSDPLPFDKIREVVDTFHAFKPRQLRDIISDLQQEYLTQQRAFRLEEIAQGFLLRTCEEYGGFIEVLQRNKRAEKLSQASAEVLAIIAYRHPITRPQIDAIRGVDSSGILQNLLDRQLIEAVGKLEAPGRPTLYGITQDFLQHFGLRNTHELPALAETEKN